MNPSDVFFNRPRLAEVTWEPLSVVGLFLAGVRHVGRDIHQAGNRWIRARFRNYSSPVAVSDKDAWAILLSEGKPGGSYILFKGCLWFLDNADVVAVLDKYVGNTFPARTIGRGAVDQNNIPNAMLLVLR